ncbi:Prolactin regulatory element-binding protein [Nymphon striatum]|nr:Prolactin regulatory element-binding protein [Nymphon striatum]
MAPSRRLGLLARVNFPLYTVNCISERHIVVAGGGGNSKTGIDNVIEIYELVNDNGTCKAKPVTRFETGTQAVMNSCVFYDGKNYAMAVGMDNFCQLYKLKWKILSAEREGDVLPSKISETVAERRDSGITKVRKRHRTNSSSHDNEEPINAEEKVTKKPTKKSTNKLKKEDSKDVNDNSSSTEIGFDVTETSSTQTDFSKDDPFQKVVRTTPDGSLIITAGSDGSIRSWKYPKLQLLYTIKAHTSEVDDIDISPSGNKIVSVGSDGHSYIWKTKDGSKDVELKWNPPNTQDKYLMKLCRFGRVEGKSSKPGLFTVATPAIRKKPAAPCYIIKWNTTDFLPAKVIVAGTDIISTLAINDDGRFLAVGTLSGSVHIYIAYNLKRLKAIEDVHNIFVTGLEFLSSSEHTKMITGGKEASVVSVSVDNHICVNHIDERISEILFLFQFSSKKPSSIFLFNLLERLEE